MISSRCFLFLLLVAAHLTLCISVPRPQREVDENCTGDSGEIGYEGNRFDLAPVGVCEVPMDLSVCTNVDYPVPSIMARLARKFEIDISSYYEGFLTQVPRECADALRDIRCAMSFPRCSDDGQTVTLGADLLNCTGLLSACPETAQNHLGKYGLCDLNGTYPLGDSASDDTCNPVTSYYNYSFAHCPVHSDWIVTEWMYELMKYEDIRIRETFDSYIRREYILCWDDYVKYRCQLYGRCWTDSSGLQRVETVNTYESCERTINCYPDSEADNLRDSYDCSLWPTGIDLTVPCTPTIGTEPSTEPTVATVSDTPTKQVTSGWPTRSTDPVSTVGSAQTLFSNCLLLSVLILLALCLVL